MAGCQNMKLEVIKRQVEGESHGELCTRCNSGCRDSETDAGTVEKEINDAEDSIGDTEGDLSEEHRMIFEQLNKIMEKQVMALCLRKWTERFRRFKQIKSMKRSSI